MSQKSYLGPSFSIYQNLEKFNMQNYKKLPVFVVFFFYNKACVDKSVCIWAGGGGDSLHEMFWQ